MSGLTGKVFAGRYRILERVGSGGMAIVYKAQDEVLGRMVAIKFLREQYVDDEQNLRHFQNEARAVATLSHPNIVKIYDVGMENNLYYIVMEYLEGRTLKDIVREEGPLHPLRAVDILRGVLRALDHSHGKGIIHRDIKPHNIIVTEEGKVKVTDFGIARSNNAATVTYSGQMVGSVYYISPEQARGGNTTFASDLYSSGVMLYEMLTGRVPFTGDNPVGIALSHVQKTAVPVTSLNRRIPECLEEVVTRAMEKNPRDRYDSARDMDRELGQVRQMIAEGKAGRRLRSTLRKHKKPLFIGGGVLAGLLLAALLVSSFWGRATQAEVPDLVGLSLEDAEVLLEGAGFLDWVIGQSVHSDEFEENVVMGQRPEPGVQVSPSREVSLTVSLGPVRERVPSVVGQNERNAIINLGNVGFESEVSYAYSDSLLFREGDVIEQLPVAGEDAPRGSLVQLVVSRGPELRETQVPDVRGLTLSNAEARLIAGGLEVGNISNATSYEYFSGQVASQEVAPGEVVMEGTPIGLVLSGGPGPVHSTSTIQFTLDEGTEEDVLILVVVEDESGTNEVYRQRHAPGETLRIDVDHVGSATATVYQNDTMIFRTSLP